MGMILGLLALYLIVIVFGIVLLWGRDDNAE